MEVRMADYKDLSFLAQDENIEQTTISGNRQQTVHIMKTANMQRENLLGRKIGFDEILSYIKECGDRYDNLKKSKKRKRKI